MKLATVLTPGRCVFLQSTAVEEVFNELIDTICRDEPSIDCEEARRAVWERERLLTTRVAKGIAIPHARLGGLERVTVAVGVSKEGISYVPTEEELVHLVIMIVGEGPEHLEVLRQIALKLSDRSVYDEILESESPQKVYDTLVSPLEEHVRRQSEAHLQASTLCFFHAMQLKDQVGARALVVHADAISHPGILGEAVDAEDVYLVSSNVGRLADAGFRHCKLVAIPYRGLTRTNQVEIALLFVLAEGYLRQTDKVVTAFGSPGSGQLDTIRLTELATEFTVFFSLGASTGGIQRQVLARVIQMAAELAGEGREGKAIGTVFVIADQHDLSPHTQQLIVNPFKGYGEEERNILDPSLAETVKEFSRIDGAFVVRGDGVILSAGTYLRTDGTARPLQSGLGARHTAAASITARTDAVSVALSESTRKISIYKGGECIMTL